MKEPQNLKWVEDLLPEGDFRRKPMFGGFAYYIEEKIRLVMFEGSGDRTYRGQAYPFELWRGCMFPVEKEFQDKALARFPFLIRHPVLGKWLYLPMDTEGFDDMVTEVLSQAVKPFGFWGTIPTRKRKKEAKVAKVLADKIDTRIDTRRPRMFSDEPAADALERAIKISDLKNLGAVSEREFAKIGIKTVKQFVKLGWQKTMLKLIEINPKNRHSLYAYAMIGALKNQDWNGISELDKAEAREFVRGLIRKEKQAKDQAKSKKTAKKASKKKM